MHNNFYGDILLTIDKKFVDDKLSLTANLGASLVDDKNKASGFEGHLATVANKFSVYNISMTHTQTKPYADRWHDQNQAVYGTLQLGWNGMVYVDGTVRNDWSSQLAFTPNQSVCYYSAGLSGVISSMADLSGAGISFLKVRGSYSTAGNPPQRFITGVNTPLTDGGNISTATEMVPCNIIMTNAELPESPNALYTNQVAANNANLWNTVIANTSTSTHTCSRRYTAVARY